MRYFDKPVSLIALQWKADWILRPSRECEIESSASNGIVREASVYYGIQQFIS